MDLDKIHGSMDLVFDLYEKASVFLAEPRSLRAIEHALAAIHPMVHVHMVKFSHLKMSWFNNSNRRLGNVPKTKGNYLVEVPFQVIHRLNSSTPERKDIYAEAKKVTPAAFTDMLHTTFGQFRLFHYGVVCTRFMVRWGPTDVVVDEQEEDALGDAIAGMAVGCGVGGFLFLIAIAACRNKRKKADAGTKIAPEPQDPNNKLKRMDTEPESEYRLGRRPSTPRLAPPHSGWLGTEKFSALTAISFRHIKGKQPAIPAAPPPPPPLLTATIEAIKRIKSAPTPPTMPSIPLPPPLPMAALEALKSVKYHAPLPTLGGVEMQAMLALRKGPQVPHLPIPKRFSVIQAGPLGSDIPLPPPPIVDNSRRATLLLGGLPALPPFGSENADSPSLRDSAYVRDRSDSPRSRSGELEPDPGPSCPPSPSNGRDSREFQDLSEMALPPIPTAGEVAFSPPPPLVPQYASTGSNNKRASLFKLPPLPTVQLEGEHHPRSRATIVAGKRKSILVSGEVSRRYTLPPLPVVEGIEAMAEASQALAAYDSPSGDEDSDSESGLSDSSEEWNPNMEAVPSTESKSSSDLSWGETGTPLQPVQSHGSSDSVEVALEVIQS